ncbi:MAG: hypothetical protein HZB95_05080 [Nitrosomonadales bacterium]|nr:hypothetical protein [Nitrosomonadales bacterium]
MTIVMNMSSYEIERETEAAEAYGDEVMCAGWNPQLELVGEHARASARGKMPGELATADVETFLNKMYAYQQ